MNTKKQQPNQVIQALLLIGRTSTVTELRNMAFILIRRSFVVLSSEGMSLTFSHLMFYSFLIRSFFLGQVVTRYSKSCAKGVTHWY